MFILNASHCLSVCLCILIFRLLNVVCVVVPKPQQQVTNRLGQQQKPGMFLTRQNLKFAEVRMKYLSFYCSCCSFMVRAIGLCTMVARDAFILAVWFTVIVYSFYIYD